MCLTVAFKGCPNARHTLQGDAHSPSQPGIASEIEFLCKFAMARTDGRQTNYVTRASSQQHNAVVKTDSAAVVQFFCLRQFTHGVGDFVHVGDYV